MIELETLNIVVGGFAVVPIVTGLVELVKRMGVPIQFVPLSAILVGVGIMFLGMGVVWAAVLPGIVVGLAACGLWSGSKTTFNG